MKIGVIGATGAVGRQMLSDLEALWEQKQKPESWEVSLFASPKSAGQVLDWGGRSLVVKASEASTQAKLDYVLMSAGSGVSRQLTPLLAAGGAIVIDNSSCWRSSSQAELVVPEVNGKRLVASMRTKKIVANPNCSTIQAVVPLSIIQDKFGLSKVSYTTFQSVSGAGNNGMQELVEQVRAVMSHKDPVPSHFKYPIAFSCFPEIGAYGANGYTEEESKMMTETRTILGNPDLLVAATCVRIPSLNCHGVQMDFTVKKEATVQLIAHELENAGLSSLIRMTDGHLKANIELAGTPQVYWGRLREDPTGPKSFKIWTMSDNLKKGAATNAVQILELLINS